jgi:hypothetical protein
MAVEPTYLIDMDKLREYLPANDLAERYATEAVREKWLVPDTRLQAIADAYREWKDWWQDPDIDFQEARNGPDPSVFALLDALTQENDDG